MNITYENVDVTTPFFHENNTAAMNSYEAPMEPMANAVTEKTYAPCKACEAAAKSEAAQSNPEENTLAYVIQASISNSAYRKQRIEECPFQLGGRHPPACKTIINNIVREHEKIEKSSEITRRFVRQTIPMEDTNPVPWRWENRTAVPVEERGACLLYRPVTHQNASHKHKFQSTPFCLLHENDVVDNGTVMCLQSGWGECIYGNETVKAMLEIDTFYRSEIPAFPAFKLPEFPALSEIIATACFIILIGVIIVGALHKARVL